VRISVKALESFCGFFLLFWFIGAWVVLIVNPDELGDFGNAADASPILRLIWIPIYVLVLGLIALRLRYFLPILLLNWPPLLLCLIAGASVIWSVSPDDTIRRTIALTMTTLFGLYVGMRFNQMELLRLLAWSLGITMVASWAVSLALPDMGIMKGTLAGAWRGVFVHKNQLGSTMMLAVVVFGVLAYRGGQHRRLAWLGVLSALTLVVLSNSQTALLICVILVGLFGLSKLMSLPARHAVPLSAMAIAAALALVIAGGFLIEPLLQSLGRDITLTGRSEIWLRTLDSAAQRPWLGYGYEAFWVTTVQEERAHNGFLDTWLGLGGIGLIVLVISYSAAVRDGILMLRVPGNKEAYWVVLFLGMYFLQNMTESTILKQNELLWVLYCAVSTRAVLARRALSGRNALFTGRLGRATSAA